MQGIYGIKSSELWSEQEHHSIDSLKSRAMTREWEGQEPERTATSFISRPFDVNLAVMFSSGSIGDGNCSLAAFSLAVNPSLRPNERG